MGDIDVDEWYWMMKEHKRKGHHLIDYGSLDTRTEINKIDRHFFDKSHKDIFWKKHSNIALKKKFLWWEKEVEV